CCHENRKAKDYDNRLLPHVSLPHLGGIDGEVVRELWSGSRPAHAEAGATIAARVATADAVEAELNGRVQSWIGDTRRISGRVHRRRSHVRILSIHRVPLSSARRGHRGLDGTRWEETFQGNG